MAKSIGTFFMVAAILLCLTCAIDSRAALSIPEEPGEEFLVEQSYDTIVGLLFRAYSLHRDGEVDYRTARQIMGISYDDPASAELDVAPYPIFYWYDPKQDGQWELWMDPDGEGRLTDAVRYSVTEGPEINRSSALLR
jgi:hypothetical protein